MSTCFTRFRCPHRGPYRIARQGAFYNGLFWGIGNGLVSTSLIIYMIRDICEGQMATVAIRTTIAWVIAAPRLAGLLRLATPFLLDTLGNRKGFVIFCYLLSPLILSLLPLGIPLFLKPVLKSDSGMWQIGTPPVTETLIFIVLIWCLYHLVENLGTIAYWSWLGDLVRPEIRGRFLGIRESYLLLGVAVGGVTTGLYTYFVGNTLPLHLPRWHVYLLPTYCGIVMLSLSVLPLFQIPEIPWKRPCYHLTELVRPLRKPQFLYLLVFGCWIQIAQGVSQSVQNFYPTIMGVSLLLWLSLQTSTRLGQFVFGPLTGRLLDRYGAFGVMTVSLLCVSVGSLFYMAATPQQWYYIACAAGMWVFWIGINVGLSKLLLEQTPFGEKNGVITVYFTLTTLSFGIATLAGGYFADTFAATVFVIPLVSGQWQLSCAQFLFFSSFLLRILALPLLWKVRKSCS